MTIPSTALRALKRKQREGFHELDAAIESLEAEIRKSKASKRTVHAALPRPEVPGKTKIERAADRNARAIQIRTAVMERAGGCCEFCKRDGFALEWSHIFGGGERRHREDVTNTAANCWDCHRGWERAKPQTFRDAKEWAIRLGFREALREIEHREALAAAAPTNKHRRTA